MIAESWADVRKDIRALAGNIRVLANGDFGPMPPDVVTAYGQLEREFQAALDSK